MYLSTPSRTANQPSLAWDDLDNLFRAFSRNVNANALRVNVRSSENAVEVSAALPGYQAKDVQIEVHDDVLSIVAESSDLVDERSYAPSNADAGQWVLREYGLLRQERHLSLGFTPADNAISASMKDGILTIAVKRPETAKARRIAINTAGQKTPQAVPQVMKAAATAT